MHIANLFLGLSTSLTERRDGGRVVNRWAPFQDLYKNTKDMMTWMFGRKNKGRYADYEKKLREVFHKVFCADLPNDTRVGGSYNLLRDALRSMFALCYYAEQNRMFYGINLSKAQWKQIAQFVAIMSRSVNICFVSQKDRVETAGEMIIELIRLKEYYDCTEIYEVVDVNSKKEWPADTPFKDLPRVKMAISEDVAEKHNIP